MSKTPDGNSPKDSLGDHTPKSGESQSPGGSPTPSQHGHGSNKSSKTALNQQNSKTVLNQQNLKTAELLAPLEKVRTSMSSRLSLMGDALKRTSKVGLNEKDKIDLPTKSVAQKSSEHLSSHKSSEHLSSHKSSEHVSSASSKPKSSPKEEDDPDGTKPIFIYGGPFIKLTKPSMFLDTNAPINVPLQGTFRRSYAYHSLKERLPVILTKVIDYCSRESGHIKSKYGASDDDIQTFVKNVSELKSDLITNKNYKELRGGTPDARKWNEWMQGCDPPNYFGNVWCWSECYVYRRLKDACDLTNKLKDFDYFEESKNGGFQTNLEPMCVVAERMFDMLNKGERAKTKEDFVTLLKICMWSNRCDMSLTIGEQVPFSSAPPPPPPNAPPPAPPKGKKKAPPPPPPDPGYVDPFVMIANNKDYLLADDSGKAFEALSKKADALNTKIANPPEGHEPPAAPADGEEPPKVPCPAKMVIPQAVIFDIVCDNAGYELFTDLCFAHFLIAQELVQKVRFHVKKFPWFVSDTTERDFKFVIESCKNANFNRTVEPPSQTPLAEGEEPPPSKVISSEYLKTLGQQWAQLVEDGTFLVMAEDYWTYPHGYRDMKKYDPNLYRKLQFPVMILFKGDLNYRKLLGDRNVVSTQTLELSMQGFIPAPIIAARTIKSELVCGLPKAKANQPSKSEQLNALDDKWMTRGYWGVIQLCPKAEPFKPSTQPCIDYGETCFGQTCPIHSDI